LVDKAWCFALVKSGWEGHQNDLYNVPHMINQFHLPLVIALSTQ